MIAPSYSAVPLVASLKYIAPAALVPLRIVIPALPELSIVKSSASS